jgi:hypothetical protein
MTENNPEAKLIKETLDKTPEFFIRALTHGDAQYAMQLFAAAKKLESTGLCKVISDRRTHLNKVIRGPIYDEDDADHAK